MWWYTTAKWWYTTAVWWYTTACDGIRQQCDGIRQQEVERCPVKDSHYQKTEYAGRWKEEQWSGRKRKLSGGRKSRWKFADVGTGTGRRRKLTDVGGLADEGVARIWKKEKADRCRKWNGCQMQDVPGSKRRRKLVDVGGARKCKDMDKGESWQVQEVAGRCIARILKKEKVDRCRRCSDLKEGESWQM
jgi:hypothetical protein